MLTANLGWLSDAYRPKQIKEEQAAKSHEKPKRVFQDSRAVSPSCWKQQKEKRIITRVRSAPPRSSTFSQHRKAESCTNLSQPCSMGKSATAVSVRRPASATPSSSTRISVFTHQIPTGRPSSAASGRSSFRTTGPSSRPSSGRIRATTRPLGQIRSAWTPETVDAPGLLYPADNGIFLQSAAFKDFDEDFRRSPSIQVSQTDVGADSSVSLSTRLVTKRPPSGRNQFRFTSPVSFSSASDECRSSKSDAKRVPWTDDPRIGLYITGHNCDTSTLHFDRHSRQHHESSHTHHSLLLWQAQPMHTPPDARSPSPVSTSVLRPESAASIGVHSGRSGACSPDPVQRYIDCHRPRTAPLTRKEVKNFGAANQSGYLPHYCNFVRSKTLHDRNNSPALVTDDDDDEYDGGLLIEPPALGDYDDHHEDEDNREVDTAPTDTDLQRDDSKSPTTKPAPTVNITDSGQDAGQDRRRDVATSTADHDPETLIRRLKEGGLAGPASRDPIQIPSADGSLKPTDTTDSARSKTENNLDALFDTLTSKNVKAKKLPPGLVDQPPPKVKGKRACAKKEKMPVKERKRKGKKKEKSKESSEPQEQQPEVPAQNLDIPDTPAASEIPVPTAEVPDLPTMNIGSEGPSRDKRRNAKKQQLVAPTPVPVQKAPGVKPVASTEPAFTYYDFGDLGSTTATTEDTSITDWTSGRSDRQERTVLSLQSSRFELPMDMKSLETMSPQEYLRKYCVVSPRRQALYNKVFWKHKDRSGSLLGQRNLCEALKDVLVNTIKYGQGEDLCNLLEIEDNTTVDLKLFSGVAALAERILYPDFVTEDTADKTEYHKDKVECADFCGLKWKLHGVQVGEHVRQLLESLG